MKCFVCGHVSGHTILGSWREFWPHFGPELDTRSQSRNRLDYRIQTCPFCGYCAGPLSEAIAGAATIVASPAYKAQLKDTEFPELANRFLCYGMIEEDAGNFSAAGKARLYAAWACDDLAVLSETRMVDVVLATLIVMLWGASLGMIKPDRFKSKRRYDKRILAAARKCRYEAVELFQRALDAGQGFTSEAGMEDVILVDLLRRSDHLGEALSRCRSGLARSPELKIRMILEYELHLIREGDRDRHWLFEAMGQTREDIIGNRAKPRSQPEGS
ncbi:hypothetical protein P12x_002755 [Tundrisphaera lichenicola]|uniref:hypothetical protein n=1 Tax=Tundrisphaera lichenicola TaxID=2029860 RepID=UPI003EBE6931